MKNRTISLALALTLCLGLALPAFAAEDTEVPSPAEQVECMSLTHTTGGLQFESYKGINVDYRWLAGYPQEEGEEDLGGRTMNGYYAVGRDTVFTVTNESPAESKNYFNIYLAAYANEASGTLVKDAEEGESPEQAGDSDSSQTPDEAEDPDNTQAPDEAKDPDNTQTPDQAKDADNTQAPDEAKAPDNTQTPDEAKAPDNTQAPDEAEDPDNTQAPDKAKDPDEGKAPAETGKGLKYKRLWGYNSLCLTNQGGFIREDLPMDEYGGRLVLKSGESVNFSLPGEARDTDGTAYTDVVYEVTLIKWDMDHPMTVRDRWGYPHEEISTYYKRAWFKVDEAAVDRYMTTSAFEDVPAGVFFDEPVRWALRQQITTGTTKTQFSPYEDCSQAQILTFLWRAVGEPRSNATAPVDVPRGTYYLDALRWAAEKKMIRYGFDPDAPCTRATAVTYIWKAFDSPETFPNGFVDVAPTADYANAVYWAVGNGITTGTSVTEFSPDSVCNRAQIATFLYRAYH